MRIWSYPGIYPYPEGNDLTTGIFIHKQNLALKEIGAEIAVVQPWDAFPFWPIYKMFPDWQRFQQNQRPKERELDGLTIYHPHVFSPKPSRLWRKPHSYYLLNELEHFFRKMGVRKGHDVIHAQWLIPDGHHAVLLAKRLGISCSVEMQGDDIQVWPHQSETHLKNALWTLENADLVLGCSDFLCQEAIKLYGRQLETHTIYTGIDLDKFSPPTPSQRLSARNELNINENEIIILNVGSAIARKGWLELFQSIALLDKEGYSNVKILAASGGLKEFDLLAKAHDFNIQDKLVDLGQVDNKRLVQLYYACDIFCLPSYWEGLANVLCEAMACGCAVVTTAVSGHPEVVKSGENGELVDPKNVESLKEALKRLLSNPERRLMYGQKARLTAENKIKSHNDNARILLNLLKHNV